MNATPYILIAEDDADDRFLLQMAFEEKGFPDRLHFVENGVELLDFLENIRNGRGKEALYPEFILLDLNMPKKSGREALVDLKSTAGWRVIPVVVYTTTKNESEIQKCYELGADSYIVKPTRFEGLLETVDRIRRMWVVQ